MSIPFLIGLGGYAECGKDAVADLLVEHGNSWFKTYMSKPLEQALLKLDPVVFIQDNLWSDWFDWEDSPYYGGHLEKYCRYSDLHELVGYEKSKKVNEVRRLLQVLGTEIGRKMFGEDVWVNKAFGEVDGALQADERVVITGIRYRNELAALSGRGGLAVWVARPGYGPVNAHSSDNTLGPEDFDLTVDNDGSLEDLQALVIERFVKAGD